MVRLTGRIGKPPVIGKSCLSSRAALADGEDRCSCGLAEAGSVMDFRSFTLAVVLVSFLTVGDPITRSMAQSGPRPASSAASSSEPLQAVRARFFTRIREMLAEAKALEAAGKPGEAMLIGVRASRMLDVIGGESVWPRARKDAGSSPAQYLAILAEKYDPDVLKSARTSLPSPRKAEARSTTQPGPRDAVPANSLPAATRPTIQTQRESDGKPSSPFDRFPQLPLKSRSWLPVGDAVAPADDWTPVGGPKIKPSASAGPPVSPTPIPVFEEPGRGQHFGEKSEGGGVSDQQVGPIPVNLVSPARPDSNAIDIRAEEEAASGNQPAMESPGSSAGPLKLPSDVQPVPVPVEAPERPAAQKSPSISDAAVESPATSDSGEPPSSVAADSNADSSSLWFATLIGACGGVLLVLAGSILVRRFATPRNEGVVTETIAKRSVSSESENTVEGMTESMIAASILPGETIEDRATESPSSSWKPGASWDGSADSDQDQAAAAATGSEQTAGTQLQLYRGDAPSSKADNPAAGNSSEVTSEQEARGAAASDSHVEPVVPFRVIGTDVVLGEAESARVDEELQQRREKILQRVLEENSEMQRRLDEQDEQPREAA